MEINALGQACPLPVIQTKKALEASKENVDVLVDNETAVKNLEKLAQSKGCQFSFTEEAKDCYRVHLERGGEVEQKEVAPSISGKTVVVISSNAMGNGDDELGKNLIKGFLFSLTQMDTLPDTMIFYNGGAFLTAQDPDTIKDLKALSAAGVEIITCGACLQHYGLTAQVGEVSNMYVIAEKQMQAGRIIRP